ncbi:hypothetical protein BON30_05550 [Cystobacter ferrugineus]|uniref:PFL domain-containing protein n=1 Tax=Cystobacter ferrugineus TaxID=83449 RepID=A0A1L9BK79_9BACT|nr:hypothetical protein BON30_05550 [Cystobacter ferrugineus]
MSRQSRQGKCRCWSPTNQELIARGASKRDEAGIYFAGYARSVRVLESIMDSQIGGRSGFMRDRLLCEMRSDLGGFYYIPNQRELGLEAVPVRVFGETDWTYFPGVNWNRLDRHYQLRSSNGYMYYNHRDYLFRMSTLSAAEREKYLPPSPRVLQLLGIAFSRWQDNWYFDRSQRELKHLCAYVAEKYGPEKAREVMALPVMERMGWTIKVSLGDVFTSEEYGFRGRRRDEYGNWYNGADTYTLNAHELIVGALPNLGLGQGRYVIDYARKDEEIGNFFAGLSHASGVGHLVPGFQRALDLGLEGLAVDVKGRRDRESDPKKRSFYEAALLSLEGVQDYCRAYARLAKKESEAFREGSLERRNLLAISTRMTSLVTERPRTLLEAAQLIFTLHACLHLIGEPTAIGRLDQMLHPFYEKDLAAGHLDAEQAQEIIDCFWLKVGEKVQLNRQFVEDHQPYGNLAMGGSSGNYPQGAANNQWIQQVTVGGTVADDAPGAGKPAYNAITLFCLRAARRLPLNAPLPVAARAQGHPPRVPARGLALHPQWRRAPHPAQRREDHPRPAAQRGPGGRWLHSHRVHPREGQGQGDVAQPGHPPGRARLRVRWLLRASVRGPELVHPGRSVRPRVARGRAQPGQELDERRPHVLPRPARVLHLGARAGDHLVRAVGGSLHQAPALDVRQAGRWAALRVRHHERRVPLAPLVRVHR